MASPEAAPHLRYRSFGPEQNWFGLSAKKKEKFLQSPAALTEKNLIFQGVDVA